MSSQVLWFATRGAGIVSLLLFTAVVCLGILTSGRWQARGWPRFLTAELHRSLALVSVAFLGLHIATAIVDPYTSLGLASAILPLASPYRPFWIGLGVVALDLVLALTLSSLFRARLGPRVWRTIHWSAYTFWPIALLHGIGAGSDAFAGWMLGLDAACLTAVGLAIMWRLDPRRDPADLARVVASAASGRGVIR